MAKQLAKPHYYEGSTKVDLVYPAYWDYLEGKPPISSIKNSNGQTTGVQVTGILQASGDIRANKVWNAVYNDYAELFEIDDDIDYQVGDILSLNPETGKYRKSNRKYDNLVVGVVSNTYGHLLGGHNSLGLEENLKLFAPVGLSGRVKVNIIGDVRPGDLIVSSDTPGTGVVDNDPPVGTVVGKALSNSSDGQVEMLIMMR